jgi:hypothetical protein
MKKTIISAILLISCIFAETNFTKVPKIAVLKTGYRYMHRKNLNYSIDENAAYISFDVAWEVSGFGKKPSAYISIPMGFTYIPSKQLQTLIMNYGWSIRHDLLYNKPIIPFLSYSLLLNQLFIEDVAGRIMGHETILGGGVLIKRKLIIDLGISIISYPFLGSNITASFTTFNINAGIQFP